MTEVRSEIGILKGSFLGFQFDLWLFSLQQLDRMVQVVLESHIVTSVATVRLEDLVVPREAQHIDLVLRANLSYVGFQLCTNEFAGRKRPHSQLT